MLVSEKDIAESFRAILSRAKLVGEPAGVVAAAAFFSGKVKVRGTNAAVLTGGNVTLDAIQKMLHYC